MEAPHTYILAEQTPNPKIYNFFAIHIYFSLHMIYNV